MRWERVLGKMTPTQRLAGKERIPLVDDAVEDILEAIVCGFHKEIALPIVEEILAEEGRYWGT